MGKIARSNSQITESGRDTVSIAVNQKEWSRNQGIERRAKIAPSVEWVTITNFILILCLLVHVYLNHVVINEVKSDLRFAIHLMNEVDDPVKAAMLFGREHNIK